MSYQKTTGKTRRAEQQAKVAALFESGEATPSPRRSRRWVGRTKGRAFSRCQLIETIPALPGQPAVFLVQHPTKGRIHAVAATPESLSVFAPSLPAKFAAVMLGQ